MKSMSKIRSVLLCCSAFAAMTPAAVFAQEAADEAEAPGTTSDQEIIVTATRRNEALKDVAMSVNVATGEQLERLNIFDAKDIQQLAPGLELTNTSGRNNTTTLRGITFDPDQGTSPAVQVYLNEMPVDAQTVYTAIYDIQQVEVLRGPQGLLRGLSAPAGSITFATRKPSFTDIEGYAQATATTREGYNVQGGVSLPFNDMLALRLAAVVDGNRLNHVRNVNRGNDRSRSQTESFRATLGFQPSDAFTAYLTYQYLTADNKQYQQVSGPGNTPTFNLFTFLGLPVPLTPNPAERSGPALTPSDYGAVAEGVFRNENRTHIVNLQTSYDLGGATLSLTASHQNSKLTINRDQDPGNAVPNYVGVSRVFVPYIVNSGELRLQSNNDEGFGWGVGAFYTKQTGTTVVSQVSDAFFFPASVPATRAVLGAGPFLPIATTVSVPVNSETISFNGNLRYKSGPLKIEGGIRYSILKKIQTADIFVNSPGNAFAGVAPFSIQQVGVPAALQRIKEEPFTGGINISYEFAPDLNVYAAYGHSFRAGSSGVSVPVGVSNDLVQTGPEKTDSYEIGFKGAAFNNRMNFSVAGFYQKIDGYLSRFTGIFYNCPELFGTCFNSPPAPGINNAVDPINGSFDFNYNGDATIKGIEAQFDGRITDNWDLGVAASYIEARFDNARVPCNTFNAAGRPVIRGTGNVSYCQTSRRLADVPDFNMTANTEIRFPVGNVLPYVRALYTYRPGFNSVLTNFNYQDRHLLNVFVGVRSDAGWDINLFARNLLGQNRITNISDSNSIFNTAAGIPYDSGYRLVNVMAPREFGLTASYKF